MPPPITGIENPLNAIPQVAPMLPPDNPPQVNAPGGNVPNPQVQVPPMVIPPDPALMPVVANGTGPNLAPGGGQGAQFAANHVVTGRDWDLHSAKGMLETSRKSVEYIRSVISGEAAFRAYDEKLSTEVAAAAAKYPAEKTAALFDAYKNFKMVMAELEAARSALMAAVKTGEGCDDPYKSLEQILKTMRVFRYDMQVELNKRGHAAGKMDFYEGGLRDIQHAFTFGVGSKVKETFARVVELENSFKEAISSVRNCLHELDRTKLPPQAPRELWLSAVVGDALELSHQTNDRIRAFRIEYERDWVLREIVSPIAKKGGSRKVEFTCGVGALIGLGFSAAFTAGVRAGARFTVIGDIQSSGPGTPLNVTYRIAMGAEAKAVVKAGDEFVFAEAKAEASAGAEISGFVTRSYPTVEDLIRDAGRCKLATSRTIPGVIWGGIKSLGFSIGRLGRSVFRWLGRKSGDVMQAASGYLESLKARGLAGMLDRLLARQANPYVSAESEGMTVKISGKAVASGSVGAGVTKLAAAGTVAREVDCKVKTHSYIPIGRAAREAKTISALNALMLPGPDGGNPQPVRRFPAANSQELYNMLDYELGLAVREAQDVSKKRLGISLFADKRGFAIAANKIRSLLLSAELACREGRLPREAVDTLYVRYSNPKVKFPPDIYREYFLTGSGAAKPAKIRNSASASFQVGFFTAETDSLTSDIANPIGKALAQGGVKEMRHQTGLDQKFEYRFSSEKPVKKDADPRPWENVTKTKHSLAITASTPIRVLLEAITRTEKNDGERLENKTKSPAKDAVVASAKDIAEDAAKGAFFAALPGLLLSGVKASAYAAVKSWLDDKENFRKLVIFCMENLGTTLEVLVGVVEWAIDHPDAVIQLTAMAMGTTGISESERNKVVTWSYIDGKIDTISISSERSSKLGINVDPLGVGLGVGFDLSYTVTESVKDRSWMPNPTLVGLLEKSEMFLFGETGIELSGGGEEFKMFLSRNALGVEKMLRTLRDPKQVEIYLKAQLQASGDFELQERLQNAWLAVQRLPDDATLDAKVDAAHKLLVAMTLAYRCAPQA